MAGPWWPLCACSGASIAKPRSSAMASDCRSVGSVDDITGDPIPAVSNSYAPVHDGAVSGPLRADDDADDTAAVNPPDEQVVELTPSRRSQVGETTVWRALPTRQRRT